jgi:hypothetical protein
MACTLSLSTQGTHFIPIVTEILGVGPILTKNSTWPFILSSDSPYTAGKE